MGKQGKKKQTWSAMYKDKKKATSKGGTTEKKAKTGDSKPRGKEKIDIKRDLRKEVMRIFEDSGDRTFNHKQITAQLGYEDDNLGRLVKQILVQLHDKKKIKEVERGKYKIGKGTSKKVKEGSIQITRGGRGFVLLDDGSPDVMIQGHDLNQALNGDRVEVSISGKSEKPRGKIVDVVQRARDQYVGIIELTRNNGFMLPSDTRIHVDFFIPGEKLNGAKNGDKVVVKIINWDRGEDNPKGEVVTVLGKPGVNEVEMHAIMAEYGLPWEFPDEIVHEADKIPKEITAKEIKKRRDMRDTLTFTIDPHDAKDFDDALSFKTLENGHYEIGVHIADVAHYLRPGTLLDEEAFNRATSVYLVDRVVPMLPEVLSNELCSLRPNEEKLTFSAVFEMDDTGKIHKEWFGRTVTYSDRRFTYEEAQEVIETGKGDHSEPILKLHELAKKLRKKRFKTGGIEFNTEEVKFKLDETGKPVGVYTKVMKDSNQLIEDFMLLANKRVAAFVGRVKNGNPKTFIYRIHDKPDEDKLQTLRLFVSRFGYQLPKMTNERSSMFILNKLLTQVDGTPEADVIKTMAIRTMSKAEYSTQNIGHYGLAFEYYSHFTSPIRRYPDVMVHRLLAHYLDGGQDVSQDEYENKCKHSSAMERRATEAERSSIKYKQVEYMSALVGEEFEGLISGLTNWGMYVELVGNKCEGMIPLNTLEGDFFSFDDENYVVVGQNKGQKFYMGEKLKVRVAGVDMIKKTIDFEFLSAIKS